MRKGTESGLGAFLVFMDFGASSDLKVASLSPLSAMGADLMVPLTRFCPLTIIIDPLLTDGFALSL